jgi:hypothetical protein
MKGLKSTDTEEWNAPGRRYIFSRDWKLKAESSKLKAQG